MGFDFKYFFKEIEEADIVLCGSDDPVYYFNKYKNWCIEVGKINEFDLIDFQDYISYRKEMEPIEEQELRDELRMEKEEFDYIMYHKYCI